MTYEELYNQYAKDLNLTARQYFGILKLAMGKPLMPTPEVALSATEKDYKRVMVALKSMADFTPEEHDQLKEEL